MLGYFVSRDSYPICLMMAHFTIIVYGESESFLINPNCMCVLFMRYLRKKCQYDERALIDLLDENGNLTYIHNKEPIENVRDLFQDRCLYIPVQLEKDETGGLKKVKPLLTDWEKKFPNLEKRIKVLTGEIKRKKSTHLGFRSLELPGRGKPTEGKRSKENSADKIMSRQSVIGPSPLPATSPSKVKTNKKKL